MTVIVAIDLIVAFALVGIALTKGFEDVLPFATFVCILVPETSSIPLFGLFALTTQRLVVVLLIALYFVVGKRGPGPSLDKGSPLKWLMIAQVTWSLVSTANSIVPVMSVKKLLSEVVEYYVLYAIYVRSVTQVKSIYRILNAIVAAMFVCSIFGAVEAYTRWSVMSLFPAQASQIMLALGITGDNEGRVASTFPHAILFGAALAIAITLALHLIKVADSGKKKAFLWAAIVLMFLNIYKSFSRGPWLGLILALTLLLLFERGRVRKYLLVIGTLTVLVLFLRPGVFDSISNLYTETFTVNWDSIKGLSYEYRYELRRVAQRALARDFRRQLWGYGMESFFSLHLEGELVGHPYPFLSCDSAWIELMVETGYVGLALIAALLLKPAWRAWRDFRAGRGPEKYLSLTLLACLVSYYFMMTSVAMYAWGQEGYMLWILIALVMAHDRLLRRSECNRKAKLLVPAPVERETADDLIPVGRTYCTSAVKPWGGAGGCGEPNW
jgi:O-antigen ligase